MKINVVVSQGWNKPDSLMEVSAAPTRLAGVYLTRPLELRGGELIEKKTGWHITSHDGYVLLPVVLKCKDRALVIVDKMAQSNLDFSVPSTRMQEDYKSYIGVIRQAYEEVMN